MTDPIESPEAFAERCFSSANFAERVFAADEIRARDAAVRREALLGVVRWLEQKANDVREVTRDCRREAIALKAAGKDWKDAFDRECLSSSRCSGFADAAEHVRALASGDSDG